VRAADIQDRSALERYRIDRNPQHATFFSFDLKISCILMERSTLPRAGLLDEYLIAEKIDLVRIQRSRRYFWSGIAQTKLSEFAQPRRDAGIEQKATFCIFSLVEQ
jgi:hypothetical protein